MVSLQPFHVAVESAAPGVRVIRTSGALDRSAADRLLRITDAQISLRAAGRLALRDLVVDLANVNRFEPVGLETFHAGWSERRDRGVRLHVAGCEGRILLLPLTVGRLMRDLSSFPTVEVAVAQLSPAGVELPVPRTPSEPAIPDRAVRDRAVRAPVSWPALPDR